LKDVISYHSVNSFTSWRVISLFQHTLEQQWVFSESLMRLHQHVCQLQPVALFMSFCPLQDGKVYWKSHLVNNHKYTITAQGDHEEIAQS